LKLLHQRLRATMIYVTHDQIEALTLATRIAVMQGGRIRQVGAPARSTGGRRIASLPPFSAVPA